MKRVRKISLKDLAEAEGSKVQDIIKEDLKILFCGINPGLYSGVQVVILQDPAIDFGQLYTILLLRQQFLNLKKKINF